MGSDIYNLLIFYCEIHWQSDIPCVSGNTNVELRLLQNVAVATSNYKSPVDKVAKLEFSKASVRFQYPAVGVPISDKVTVTARNADFTVTNITSSNSNFSISPTSFSLNDGQSKELTTTYTSVDSGYAFCIFNFVNDRCPEKYYASGGWKGKKLSASTLKLTHPNGGKKFLVGSDTVITWEGVSPDDTVKLEYSTDNGKTWKILTKNATNLSYIWNKIPKPASNLFIFVALMPKRFLLSLAFRYILWAQGKIKQLSLGLSLRVLARIMQRLS